MCGILAILNYDFQKQVDEQLLRQMTDTMAHRGPDDAGYWVSGPIGLGHRRLAIIDLSPAGHQPMSNEDGTIWITYNGEIYNFKELREDLEIKGHIFRSHTDTETVLHAYEEWGTECLSHFNGMWAFALWDDRHHSLFVARDRLGVKPLIYYYDEKRFICASEIKGIIADRTVPREIDPEALHHYLSLMNIPAPFTIYKRIRKLQPGHYLLFKEGKIEERIYWDLPMGEEVRDDQSKIIDTLEVCLKDSVRRRMISDVPLGVFLSGGIDSSLISAMAAQFAADKQLNTFTVSFEGLEDYDESLWARQVAGHIGSNHHEMNLAFDFLKTLPHLVRLFDEPFAISSVLALYLISKEVCKNVKVVLTGDGGDEVFGGYPWRHSLLHQYLDWFTSWPFTWFRKNEYKEPTPPIRWKTSIRRMRLRQVADALKYNDQILRQWMYFQSLYCYNEAEKAKLYNPEWAEQKGEASTDDLLLSHVPAEAPNRLARWIAFDLKTTLADEMLAKVDKATMACGLEARVPLLDYRLVESVVNLPAYMKVQGREGKRILRELGRRYLPEAILQRPKHGFNVPLKVWFRDELKSFVNDILDEPLLRESGVFRPKTVQEIWRRHQEGKAKDFSNHIFVLLCFELWRRH
ncbi:MAG: asparagine synthase (glutamine-hydrolyzing) [Thermodesulfobacteriota bacterium]